MTGENKPREQSPAPVHGDDKPLEGLDNDVVQGALTNLVNERLLVSDQRIAVSRIVRDYLKRAALQSQPDMRLVEALRKAKFALDPYDDVKPRNWVTDRENLRRAHQTVSEALAPYAPEGETK